MSDLTEIVQEQWGAAWGYSLTEGGIVLTRSIEPDGSVFKGRSFGEVFGDEAGCDAAIHRANLIRSAPDMYRLLERVMGQAHQPFECIACESFSRKDDGTPDHEDGRIQPCAWLEIQKKVRGE